MRIETKGRAALAALLCMAELGGPKAISLALVSKHTGTSLSYLQRLFRRLRDAGLVVSQKGPGGGYLLAKALEHISVLEVVNICDLPYGQVLRDSVFEQAHREVEALLAKVTLADELSTWMAACS